MKKVVALVSALVLLCGLTACSGPKKPAEPTETAPTTTTTTEFQPQKGVNMLTGQAAAEGSSRPVAFMVPNDSISIGNQIGIDKADFIMETETEGAIPRLLAVFRNAESIPEKVGPIRSARSPHITVARALGALYCHAGGSVTALSTLDCNVLDHFDALYDSKTFWRDDQLKSAIDYVHSVASSSEAILAKMEKKSISKEAEKAFPFRFSETVKTGANPGTTVQLRTTASHTVTFKYDAETGTYDKYIGKIDSCKPHKTLDGKQLSFTNILVLYAEKFTEDYTNTYNFYTGKGTGYLISAGTSRPVTYDRQVNNISIWDQDGSTALLNKGKTYLFIVDKKLAGNEIFQ